MFIRKKPLTNAKTEKTYSYYHLVEPHKNEKGTRSKVLLHIGHLDATPEEINIIITVVDRRVKGIERMILFPDKIEDWTERIYLDYVRARE